MLIIGCGDVGQRLIGLANPDRPFIAWVRSDDSARAAEAVGATAVTLDIDGDFQFPDIPPQAQWLYSAPPPRSGQCDLRLQRFLARVPQEQRPARVQYISTSSVYGDCGGDWVDETAPRNPGSDRGQRRADAEEQWQSWCDSHGVELQILRVPGIVGRGRDKLERLKKGEPILNPDEATWTNVIDADDLARLLLVLASKAPAGIYNISDDCPTTSSERALRLCQKLDIPSPPFITRQEAEATWSPMRLSFLNESRRLDIQKLKSTLGEEAFKHWVQHRPA